MIFMYRDTQTHTVGEGEGERGRGGERGDLLEWSS